MNKSKKQPIKPLSHFRTPESIKRKKHQSWSWNESTNKGVKRYLKWSENSFICDKIFKEHIEIPVRNLILNIIVKRVGDNSYTKSDFLIDKCIDEYRKEMVSLYTKLPKSRFIGRTRRFIGNFLREDLKKIWSPKTDRAVERYIKWMDTPSVTRKIYKDIEIPLRVLCERMIWSYLKKYKSTNPDYPYPKLLQHKPKGSKGFDDELRNLIDECVSTFFTTTIPYIKNGNIENNFGYTRQVISTHIVDRMSDDIKGGTTDYKNFMKVHDIVYREGGKMMVKSPEEIFMGNPEVDYITQMLNYWDKNIDEIWSRKNQELHRTCARNIVTLMRRSHRILHTKQDSMMFYLRKMLGWKRDENVKNTSKRNVFTGVIQIMRKRNQQLRKQYNRKGLIDFYYTPTT